MKSFRRCRKMQNLIGHLQTNKVGQVIEKVELIHSVDSVHLAEKIEKEAAKRNMIANILLEVNVAREDSKFGLYMEDVIGVLQSVQEFPHVCVKGLMTIAPLWRIRKIIGCISAKSNNYRLTSRIKT